MEQTYKTLSREPFDQCFILYLKWGNNEMSFVDLNNQMADIGWTWDDFMKYKSDNE